MPGMLTVYWSERRRDRSPGRGPAREPDAQAYCAVSLVVKRARTHGKVQHMYGHEVAVDLIKLQPRALPQDWIAVTVADVAEMLRQARVREPWHAP
jgi:hypothetical protein